MHRKVSVPRMALSRVLRDVYRSLRVGLLGYAGLLVFQHSPCLVLLGSGYHLQRYPLPCSLAANLFFVRCHRTTLGRQTVASSCQGRSGKSAAAARQGIAPMRPPKPNRPETGNTRSRCLPGCHVPLGWLTPHQRSTDRQMSRPR